MVVFNSSLLSLVNTVSLLYVNIIKYVFRSTLERVDPIVKLLYCAGPV